MLKTAFLSNTAIQQVALREAFLRTSPLSAPLIHMADHVSLLAHLHCPEFARSNLKSHLACSQKWLPEGQVSITLKYTPVDDDIRAQTHTRSLNNLYENLSIYEEDAVECILDESLFSEEDSLSLTFYSESEAQLKDFLTRYTYDFVEEERDIMAPTDAAKLGQYLCQTNTALDMAPVRSLSVH